MKITSATHRMPMPLPGQDEAGVGEIERSPSPLENAADRLAREEMRADRGLATLGANRLVQAAEIAVRVRGTVVEIHKAGLHAGRHVVRAERLIEAFESANCVRADRAAEGVGRELAAAAVELEGELREHLRSLCGDDELPPAARRRLVLLGAASVVEKELCGRLDALAAESPELFSPLSPDEFAGRVAAATVGVEQAKAAQARVSEQCEVAKSASDVAEGLLRPFGAFGSIEGQPAAPRGLGGERDRIIRELAEHERAAGHALRRALEAEREGAATFALVEAALKGEADSKAKRS